MVTNKATFSSASTALLTGLLCGWVLTIAPSCSGDSSPLCNANTCPSGCCRSDGTCEEGNSNFACGSNAQLCQQCGPGQSCFGRICALISANGGGSGGMGGGTASGGGTATGGGVSGTGGGTSPTGGGMAGTGGGFAMGGGTATGGGMATGGGDGMGGGSVPTGGGVATGGGFSGSGGGTSPTGGGMTGTGGGTATGGGMATGGGFGLGGGFPLGGGTGTGGGIFEFDGGLCGPMTCAGCCAFGYCLAGDTIFLCGSGGQDCESCDFSMGKNCINNSCQ